MYITPLFASLPMLLYATSWLLLTLYSSDAATVFDVRLNS